MRLSFLRALDRRVGKILLWALASPAKFVASLPLSSHSCDAAACAEKKRICFVKMKGGGSLVIAMPSLLGIRKAHPDAEISLVCTEEVKIYAELTGVFDRYIIVKDAGIIALIVSGVQALAACFRAYACVDLEPNSILSAVFVMCSCSRRRVGLQSKYDTGRAAAYDVSISFDPAAAIYTAYDDLAKEFVAAVVSSAECREAMLKILPASDVAAKDLSSKKHTKTVAIAPFTSEFAPERMMPQALWVKLLSQSYNASPLRILVLGSSNNSCAAKEMRDALKESLPQAEIESYAGACSLAQTAAILTNVCDELWAVDSGVLHIARLLMVPTRSFWGATAPYQRLRPIEGLRERVEYNKTPCSPCVPYGERPPCKGDNVCMRRFVE